ncbi:MAG: OsmC family protein [Gemmataceae bacterium]
MTGTLGSALEARNVPSAGNLKAQVEGDIEDVEGVMRITKIRIKYQFTIPTGSREKVDRALETYSEKCPAYQSVKECIACSWEAEIEEQ